MDPRVGLLGLNPCSPIYYMTAYLSFLSLIYEMEDDNSMCFRRILEDKIE